MARFDFHAAENGYLLDCQANLLNHLNTRFVAPLLPHEMAPAPLARLNPIFGIGGKDHVMVTQFAAAVLKRELGPVCGSLSEQDRIVMDALDMLLTGF